MQFFLHHAAIFQMGVQTQQNYDIISADITARLITT
jgi:hypothetical protein